jgi:hypothetical protein
LLAVCGSDVFVSLIHGVTKLTYSKSGGKISGISKK